MAPDDQFPPVASLAIVNLTGATVDALNEVSKLTDQSRTDVINRAVQLYALLSQLARAVPGSSIALPDEGPGRLLITVGRRAR